MKKINIEQSDYKQILELAVTCNSKTDLLNNLGFKNRTSQLKKLNKLLEDNNFDFSIFPNKNNSLNNSVFNNESLLKLALNCSNNYAEILKFCKMSITGSNLKTLKKYLKLFNLVDSLLEKSLAFKKRVYKKSNLQLFVENSTASTSTVRARVIKENLIKYECSREHCRNNGDWFGQKLILQLEHKNGNNKDHRLENLEFLCPNCHSITSTWGNKKRNKDTNLKVNAKQLKKKEEKLSSIIKIKYPEINTLLEMVKERGYLQVSKEIGCSDNAIRKHLKRNGVII